MPIALYETTRLTIAHGQAKTAYVCNQCGAEYNKWQGQCESCGAWNTLSEFVVESAAKAAATVKRAGYAGAAEAPKIVRADRQSRRRRKRARSIGIGELDRVLGGGLVEGSVVLVGGDPGIGKSTLLLQTLGALGARLRTLYVSGEESLAQIAARAQRLGLPLEPICAAWPKPASSASWSICKRNFPRPPRKTRRNSERKSRDTECW